MSTTVSATATMAPPTPSTDVNNVPRKPFNSISVNTASLPFATKMKKSIVREWEKLSTAITSDTDQESRTSLDKEQVRPNESLDESVFRTTPSLIPEDDGEDLLSLKRANPVFDEDEEYEEDYVPSKRQRTSTTDTFTICWNDRIVQDEEEGYQIILQE